MHRSSFDKMRAFRNAYLEAWLDTPLTILDVGSAAVLDGRGYRPLFERPGWRYIGLDMEPGENVDLVPDDPYHWAALPDASVDIVISGQAFEHIERPWLTIQEIARILRGDGLAAIIAPSAGPVHRFPTDCWRYYPDGLPALAASADLRVVEQHWDDGYAYPENAFWGEAFVLLQKSRMDPAAPFGQIDDRQAIASRCAAMLASERAWAVKLRLLWHLMRLAWVVVRNPLAELKRF